MSFHLQRAIFSEFKVQKYGDPDSSAETEPPAAGQNHDRAKSPVKEDGQKSTKKVCENSFI